MQTLTPESFQDEAQGLIDFLGGFVTEERNWRETCRPYFLNREIPKEHWDTVYYEALKINHQ